MAKISTHKEACRKQQKERCVVSSTCPTYCISENCSIEELICVREQFRRMSRAGNECSFYVANRLPIPLIYFTACEAEKKRDEFWQMMCVEIAGDAIGMHLPHDILRRFYRLGIRYNDWNIRSAVAMRHELPRDLFVPLLSDPEEEVRRHFVIAHKNDRLSCIKVEYLKTFAADVSPNSDRMFAKYALKEVMCYLFDKSSVVRAQAHALIRHAAVTWHGVKEVAR